MIIPFPTPEKRLARRIEQLISEARANHSHQVTISRGENEPIREWERLVEQFDDNDQIRVIHITHHDVLLNWRLPTAGLAS
ncbi:DUF1654 domain-containing protein [Salinicola corii]|uniref:DUF1654 domain-containing protein n=1 Tax=Salinicola corii TaxID=2606937 RepID=A0A640WGC5_9GAMM|nr:DUF1654 domain-containing protein [Salinicola corii]KAA0019226.1 DUF1654 domain-containing protein [Salinicola corii]